MKQLLQISILSVLVLLLACQDDELIICEYTPQEIIPCNNLGLNLMPIPIDTSYETNIIEFERIFPSYQYPVFNPSNPNEFAYYRAEQVGESSYYYQLCKANLCSGNINILHSWTTDYLLLGHTSTINWGKNDWITFNTENDNQISLIYANGDNLRVFSESIETTSILTWMTDTTFFGNLKVDNELNKGALFHINGTIIDTFENLFFNFDCEYDNNQLYLVEDNELKATSLEEDESQSLLQNEGLIRDFIFLGEDEVFLLTNTGIYQANVNILEYDTLISHYDRIRHFRFSSHESRPEWLLYYVQRDLIGDTLIQISRNVALLNPETGEEWILDLD